MPALLTDSRKYIKRTKTGWAGRCFTCHGDQLHGESYADVWEIFKTQMFVINIRAHHFWVCWSCSREFAKGTLLSSSLNSYGSHMYKSKN